MLFNYLFNINLLYYGIFIGTVAILGYSLFKYILNSSGSNSTITTVRPISLLEVAISSNPIFLYHIHNMRVIQNSQMTSIQKTKFYEINELFGLEMYNNGVTLRELIDIVKDFTDTELISSNINEIILFVIQNFNG